MRLWQRWVVRVGVLWCVGLWCSWVNATCLEQCKARLVFPDCSTPPSNQWPVSQKMHLAASCETCCSAPGGPVQCSPSTLQLTSLQVWLKNGTQAIAGSFTQLRTLCQGEGLYRFDGTLQVQSYQVVYGNMILFFFDVFQDNTESSSTEGGVESSVLPEEGPQTESKPENMQEGVGELSTQEVTRETAEEVGPEKTQDAGHTEGMSEPISGESGSSERTETTDHTASDAGPIVTESRLDTGNPLESVGQGESTGNESLPQDKTSSVSGGCACEGQGTSLLYTGMLWMMVLLVLMRRRQG